MATTTGDDVRVLQSFRGPRSTTNPYLVQLLASAGTGVRMETFSWSRGLRGRYDVLHVHWPEVVVQRSSRVRRWAAAAAFALVVLRASTGGRAVVRTVHNVAPHERPPRSTAAVLRWCDRRTGWWIRLNDRTPVPDPARACTVVHGHYIDWFAGYEPSCAVPGRLATVGIVRAYKGVEELLDAFVQGADPDATLVVAGRPQSEDVVRAVTALAADDPRVRLDLRHLGDAEMVQEITQAQLVVLPYRSMHNSGAALLALSLGRPVLVPDNEVTRDLGAEVGEGWVRRFEPPLTPQALVEHARAVRDDPPDGLPDLSARGWDQVASGHARAYRAALAPSRGAGA